MDSKTTVIIKTTICFRLHHLRAFVLSRVCDLTQPHKNPRSIPGTGRERLPIDGGKDGAGQVMGEDEESDDEEIPESDGDRSVGPSTAILRCPQMAPGVMAMSLHL